MRWREPRSPVARSRARRRAHARAAAQGHTAGWSEPIFRLGKVARKTGAKTHHFVKIAGGGALAAAQTNNDGREAIALT